MPNLSFTDARQSAAPIHGSHDNPIVLRKIIAAIQITASEDGKVRPGLITQLPQGAKLYVCGEGFSDRSVKVRCGEAFYYVFSQDIEQPQTFSASD